MAVNLVRDVIETIGIVGFLVTRLISLSKIINFKSEKGDKEDVLS
jgi:hypothetical protein